MKLYLLFRVIEMTHPCDMILQPILLLGITRDEMAREVWDGHY